MTLTFSAALCRGLIEASTRARPYCRSARGFPRLYAAASLKPRLVVLAGLGAVLFSAALCRGLIEAMRSRACARAALSRFSAALCRGLIEAA